MNRQLVVGIVVFLLALTALYFVLRDQPQQRRAAEKSKAQESGVETPQPTGRTINVRLFFNEPGSAMLAPETRLIPYHDHIHDQVAEILAALIAGPREKLISTIPPGTRLLDLFITENGTAYADFSQELADNHPGGSAAEINTVYSIVNTLTLNFPQIRRVQILINGQSQDTLKGHLDLSHPLTQDLSVIRMKPDEKKELAKNL